MAVSRRGLLDLGLVVTAAAAAPGVVRGQGLLPPQIGDVFVALDDPARIVIRAEALDPGGAPVVAWPMDPATGAVRNATRDNQVLLLRIPGADPLQLAAYSAICTHAGCLVSGWVAQTRRLRCPCHLSEYDPAQGGVVIQGPAPYPLPSLPVRLLDGRIMVAGAFSARPGGHASRTM